MMRDRIGAAALGIAVALLAGGCERTDPYQRSGVWQPSGVADGNLAAMVADPRDLIRGHGDPTPEPHATPLAVERLWAAKPRPFIADDQAGQSNGQANGNSQGGGSGGGSPGAGS